MNLCVCSGGMGGGGYGGGMGGGGGGDFGGSQFLSTSLPKLLDLVFSKFVYIFFFQVTDPVVDTEVETTEET